MQSTEESILAIRRAGLPYRIGRQLGGGGNGTVYEAERAQNGERVAFKVMPSHVAVSEQARQVVEREIASMRVLSHAQIVEIYEHGAVGSVFYIVMQLCPGGSIDRLMERQGGKLPVGEALRLALDALQGLAYAHHRKFVHRDLKPQNLLIGADGRGKIADFGLAKMFDNAGLSGITRTGEWEGTAPFMPREQMINFKYVKPSADVWSMAATLYNMLTGAHPRETPPGWSWRRVVLDAAIVPSRERDGSIPAAVAAVVDRALSRDPSARPATAHELWSELKEAAREVPYTNVDNESGRCTVSS